MTHTLPPMLTVPEASALLRRPPSTMHDQIKNGRFDLPCSDRPRRVQTRAVLDLTGLSEQEARGILDEALGAAA